MSESPAPPPLLPRRRRNWPVVVLVSLVLAALLAGAVWAASAWVEARRAEAGRQAEAVLYEQVAAWNAGDLDRFLDTYWESDELIFFSGGTINRGRQAVAARYRKTYQAKGKEMGQLTFADLDVRPLGPDAALARGRWRVVTTKETLEGLFTLLLRKLSGGWKIVHDHTSRDDAPKRR